ncbi:hypothetical protein [Bifidobacterium adolescentis]|uniref:hypothetical protein n=1 Tax=Bifidobacterium adolescentis TaxID=1680 RepID=UPI0032BF5CD6
MVCPVQPSPLLAAHLGTRVVEHTYDDGAFTVKVSDFGLAKEKTSDLTSTGSAMKGSIIDPALGSFRDFKPVNDIYSIGFILNYILTGKENLVTDGSRLGSIIQKCSATNSADRYQTVRGIIEDIKKADCPVG